MSQKLRQKLNEHIKNEPTETIEVEEGNLKQTISAESIEAFSQAVSAQTKKQ